MEQYINITRQTTIEQPEDIVSGEEFKYDEHSHPRSVMTLRGSNGVPYPYLVNSIIRIMIDGDGLHPFTRLPLSQLTKDRAILFSRCIQEFPDYKLDPGKSVDLYNRWINSYNPDSSLSAREKTLLFLEAQCFLQPEDLTAMFQSFNGKGSLNNREAAEKFLIESGKKWVLRNSSLRDTKYNKAYALTKITPTGEYTHTAIVHRIGEGFFSGVYLYRGQTTDSKFQYTASYPTIIHLLITEVILP